MGNLRVKLPNVPSKGNHCLKFRLNKTTKIVEETINVTMPYSNPGAYGNGVPDGKRAKIPILLIITITKENVYRSI